MPSEQARFVHNGGSSSSEVMASKSRKKSKPKSELPGPVEKRLKPFIEKGIREGIFTDESVAVTLWKNALDNPSLKDTIEECGGADSPTGQGFVADAVVMDLTSIMRQKRYDAHMEVWEVNHRTIGLAKGQPRPACFILGQAVLEDSGSVLESAVFRMALWDADTALADDIEADGTYHSFVDCRNLNAEILDLRTLAGLTSFKTEDYTHGDRAECLTDLFDITPIAELADDLSRTPQDFRLVEATVSYSDVQNSRAGNQFGKMLLKDDSTMTLDAIESGENLLLNCITSTAIVSRFGKYSKILALVTTKNHSEYGLSANLETAVGLITVAPPKAPEQTSGDDDEDDAADYFKTSSSDDDIPMVGGDDEDDEEVEEVEEDAQSASDEAEGDEDPEDDEGSQNASNEADTTESDDDDDWDEWED